MDEIINDIAYELAQLHVLTGIDFSRKLEQICQRGEFHAVKNEVDIYSAISDQTEDYESLLAAARRAVYHGFKVFILPNPKGLRTADFIFVRKGIYRLYDLKNFERNAAAVQVLIFRGNKVMSVTRKTLEDRNFVATFTKLYYK